MPPSVLPHPPGTHLAQIVKGSELSPVNPDSPETQEVPAVVSPAQPAATNKASRFIESLKMHPALWWAREICSILFWSYVLINALAFSIDDAVRQAAPYLEVVLRFKGLAFLVVVAFAWLLLGNRRFWQTVGYVVAYPFIVVLWKVPK